MLYYWWLLTLLTPLVIADMLRRASPLYPGAAWPLGLQYLTQDR